MKKLLALLLLLVTLLFTSISLVSCLDGGTAPPSASGGGGGDKYDKDGIIIPDSSDDARGTVDFSDITYERPDVDAAVKAFEELRRTIEENRTDVSQQIEAIVELEPLYTRVNTMLTYANLRSSMDTKSEYWSAEYEYISSSYPRLSKAIEDMLVAAATSPHAERFESDYFGEGLIEEYADGGDYTDALVALMEEEAELVSDYTSLSGATVVITYEGVSATYDEMLSLLADKYGNGSTDYRISARDCEALYETALLDTSVDILVELFKVRRRIGTELGDGSYMPYAYRNIYHDYTEEDFYSFISDVREYILPVYASLSSYIFSRLDLTELSELDRVGLINGAYEVLGETSPELLEVYSYMLEHGLYDIYPSSDSRFEGAFTTYLEEYSAPFLFISTEGTALDYSTLFHELGHFADSYFNYNATTSLDLSEVSSQALEFMMMTRLRGTVGEDDLELMEACLMESALSTIIFQSFYAAFEHLAYGLHLDDIDEESLSVTVVKAAEMTGLNSEVLCDVGYVLIPHIFRYPFYVQSYCTSAAAALEIYFKELEDEGEGFATYLELLVREEDMTFVEYLEDAGLSSPFESGALRRLANKIHRELLGFEYFTSSDLGVLSPPAHTVTAALPSEPVLDGKRPRAA